MPHLSRAEPHRALLSRAVRLTQLLSRAEQRRRQLHLLGHREPVADQVEIGTGSHQTEV